MLMSPYRINYYPVLLLQNKNFTFFRHVVGDLKS